MRFDCGHLDDVLAKEKAGDFDAVGIDLVQNAKLSFGAINLPVNRRIVFIEMDGAESVFPVNGFKMIVDDSQFGIHDNGAVVGWDNFFEVISILRKGIDHAVILPRRC